jgi:hypothetical protein
VNNSPVNFSDPTGHFAWAAVGALVGAAIAYGAQVYNNYQQGVTGTAAWTNVDVSQVVGGALLGTGAVLFAPAVVGLAGDALVGAGIATGSTAAIVAGNSAYHAATVMEANIVYGVPGKMLPTVSYDPATTSDVIAADYAAQANGQPTVLSYTGDRALQQANRRASTGSYPTLPPLQRHEYPYASTYEGGAGASVNYVNAGDNSVHGNYLQNLYASNNYTDGFRFFVDTGYCTWATWPGSYYANYAIGIWENNQGDEDK